MPESKAFFDALQTASPPPHGEPCAGKAIGAFSEDTEGMRALRSAPPSFPGPLAEVAQLVRLGEAEVTVVASGRRSRLRVGQQGVSLTEGGAPAGACSWEALVDFLGAQAAREASLVEERDVPASLLEFPGFEATILPYLYVRCDPGIRLTRGVSRRMVECKVPSPAEMERLLAIEVQCASGCGHAIHPFRCRSEGGQLRLRLFVGVACPLEVSRSCSRTRGAKLATEGLSRAVEARGQYSVNDVAKKAVRP